MTKRRSVVVAQCKKRREIDPEEVAPGDHPLCDECYMPMVAVKAGLR